MEEIIYFEINNWFSGVDYPDAEPFLTWMKEPSFFMNEDWVKENKLVVVACLVDMSINFRVSAPKSWVEKYCPTLLTKYRHFLCSPKIGDFLPYIDKNIGVHFIED